jgi:hypothetical protein
MLKEISNLGNNKSTNNNNNNNTNLPTCKEPIFRTYPDDSKNSRIYFNSVTGEIMDPNIPESETYEIDPDDLQEFEDRDIDQYVDICEKDKKFFKIWNRFIKNKDKDYCHMEKNLLEFVKKCGQEINNNNLKENFLLHLICLYDYQQIDKNIMNNVLKVINE